MYDKIIDFRTKYLKSRVISSSMTM